jgi:Ca-activated chloride channel homolog
MPKDFTSKNGLNRPAMPSAHRRRYFAAPLLAAFLLTFPVASLRGQQDSQNPAEAIRRSVDRVNVGVIVTDGRGKFVEGLQREDFSVLDNGIAQPLTDFAAIEEPAEVLLLIEAGPAVYFLEASHVQAAYALLNGLSAGDRVAVVKYAEAPQAITNFSPDKAIAGSALEQLRFNLGFGSLNLSSSLATVLDWLKKVRGKKTIVLLSTGVDTSPESEAQALLQTLKITDVRVLVVSLSGELRNPQPTGRKKKSSAGKPAESSLQFDQADQALKEISEAAGGRAYFPRNAGEFSAAYAEIAQLVRHEYSLAFAPPARDNALHAIEVRVRPANTAMPAMQALTNHRVDHRRAYLAPDP